jgi:hypothetical protein
MAERWVSDLNPIKARKGAKRIGSETIKETSQAATPISTIMTRFKVPVSKTKHMPTEH